MRVWYAGRSGLLTVLLFACSSGSSVAFAQDTMESPWSIGLIISMFALALGGSAAILGMWIGRDKKRPILFALMMTTLIGTAICVGMTQSYLDSVDSIQKRADLARMMDMVKEIAISSGDLELAALIEAESGEAVEMPPPEPEPEPVEGDDTDAPEGDAEPTEGDDAPTEEE